MYNEQDFQQAYDALYDFGSKLRGTVEGMKTEAETCATNMEDDVVAQNASKNLLDVLDRITGYLDTELNSLLSKLEEEKERAARLAQDNDE